MKNLRAHHHIVIASLLVFGVTCIWSWGTLVFAASANTTVDVYIGPPDSCPNIPGYQTAVPTGMQIDQDGNCYTPTPPATDMCDNIDGTQESIPSGYYHENGSCYPQPLPPTPPRDVCANLAGIQSDVPEGYLSASDDTCYRPREDQCANVPGPQNVIPDGMQRESSECFTPAPGDGTPEPPQGEEPAYISPFDVPVGSGAVEPETLQNAPPWAAYILQPLVDLVPDTLTQALRELPPEVARTFPYYVFGILTAGGVALGGQSLGILGAVGRIMSSTKRRQTIVDEKYQFLSLVVHYLHVPLSDSTSRQTKALRHYIQAVQRELDNDQVIGEIVRPDQPKVDHTGIIRSVVLWIPVMVTFAILLLGNFFFGVVGGVKLDNTSLITQTLGFTLLGLFFYRMLRARNGADHELTLSEAMSRYENQRDTAINEYIHTRALKLSQLSNDASQSFDSSGYDRFSGMLDKLQLLADIDVSSKRQPHSFDLGALVTETLAQHDRQLHDKSMKYTVHLPKIRISQHRELLRFVLSSLIDTAVSLGDTGSTIAVEASSRDDTLHVSILDTNVTVGKLIISELQHSFHTDIDGVDGEPDDTSLSLILDKIIMDYVRGDINSRPKGRGAELKLTVPS